MDLRHAPVLAGLGALALCPTADAHSLVRVGNGVVSYLSADATSLSTLVVTDAGGSRISLRDRTVDGGLDTGPCDPGELDPATSFVVEALCPAAGVQRLRLDLGEREDAAKVEIDVPATMLGGPGADNLTGGPAADQVAGDAGDDVLAGRDGDDVLEGGIGADRLDGGGGADRLHVRDGIADDVACGGGEDTVRADTLDAVGVDCEHVERVATTPPPGGASSGDRVAPRVRAGADRVQRVGVGRRSVRVLATSSEAGFVAASGVLDVAGLFLPAAVVRRRVAVAGQGVELRYVLTRGQLRQALAALRRGRRVQLRLSVVATDAAGNSREVKLARIRLRR